MNQVVEEKIKEVKQADANQLFTGERFLPGLDNCGLEIEHFQRYLSVCEFVKGKDVLDAACGEGYGSKILSDYAKSVIGIDIDLETVERAKNKYKSVGNLQFLQGSVEKLEVEDDSIDVVISFETIEHVDEKIQESFLSEIKRVLKPNGFLIMSTPNKAIYSDLHNYSNHFHVKEFYYDEYISFLHSKFQNVLLYNQSFEVVSLLTQLSKEKNEKIQYYSFDNRTESEGKYFVAIASDSDLSNINVESVYYSNSGEYEKKIERILELQKEVEERNIHIAKLDKEIEDYRQIIKNKEEHIEKLLEVEKEFEREKQSKTYRLALKFRSVLRFFFPLNSRRRFFATVIFRIVKKPKLLFRLITIKRIKNFIKTSKNEGMESVFRKYQMAEDIEKSRLNPFETKAFKVREVNNCANRSIDDYSEIVFDEYNHPKISIIIPAYNQFDYTYLCLSSIKEQSGDIAYEIIVDDDNSSDLTKQIQNVVKGIRVIRNEENLRFLRNCNNAAKYAQGDYILFLNNDTQVQEDWLNPLMKLMEDDSIGMVGSKLVYADGYLQEAGGIVWKDASAWNYGNRQNPNNSEFNYVRETDYISGAAIMIRHSLWNEIGGFDERFAPAYCEDSDLAFEVRKRGFKVVYQPKSVVVHFEGVSNGTDLSSGQKKYQVNNQKSFFEKWKDVLEKENFENGQDVFFARGRSKDKKHILFIDHYVPTYDKDAGSKTTMMYLRMLVSKGYQITFWPDNFYQEEPYTSELQQMGVFVLYGPQYAENWEQWLADNLNNFDIVYLNRPHISIKYIDKINNIPHKGKIIYYGHDLHFLRIKREYELTKKEKLFKESEEWKKTELYIMQRTDMNYFPSQTEVEAINEIDPQIPVKAITAYVFERFNEIQYKTDEREGLLFVGGFGHDPNLDAVLWFLEKIYPFVYEKTKAPFYIVGSKAPKAITEIKCDGVIVKGFVSEEELGELYKKCRIAIVPLRYGAGVKGKVVEALYNCIPVITTSVGAEGIDGLEKITIVKDDENELIETICNTYYDTELLSIISKQESDFVKKYYSLETVWNVIKTDFL